MHLLCRFKELYVVVFSLFIQKNTRRIRRCTILNAYNVEQAGEDESSTGFKPLLVGPEA